MLHDASFFLFAPIEKKSNILSPIHSPIDDKIQFGYRHNCPLIYYHRYKK